MRPRASLDAPDSNVAVTLKLLPNRSDSGYQLTCMRHAEALGSHTPLETGSSPEYKAPIGRQLLRFFQTVTASAGYESSSRDVTRRLDAQLACASMLACPSFS